MPYEWDEAKRQTNIGKHAVDFTRMEFFRWETAQIQPQLRFGERRYGAYGYIDHRLHFVVYARRRRSIRIISLRKANLREQRRYDASQP